MPLSFQYTSKLHIPSYVHNSLKVTTVNFGLSIVATGFIPKGTVLSIFSGQRITSEQAQKITESNVEDSNFITQIGENTWLLPLKREKADYFNHSCEPNSGFDQTRKLADTLVAMRDINPGEQVTYHYAFSDVDADYEFDCACGTTTCTGKFSTTINREPAFIVKYWDYIALFLKDRITWGHHPINHSSEQLSKLDALP